MNSAKERICVEISTKELERRWSATRLEMEEKKIDFLIMQNSNSFLGGYVKWFTDIPAVNGYPTTVIFPRDVSIKSIIQTQLISIAIFQSLGACDVVLLPHIV